jgi:hypothetical protein
MRRAERILGQENCLQTGTVDTCHYKLSKPIKHVTPRMTPNVNCGLWVTMRNPLDSSLAGDVDRVEAVCMKEREFMEYLCTFSILL